MGDPISRRRWLACLTTLLAGCATGPETEGTAGTTDGSTGARGTDDTASPGSRTDGTTATRSSDTTTTGPGETTTPGSPAGATDTASGSSETPGSAGLDLREANVTGVTVERDDGRYRFAVTLYHDDDGEDGYANWWQVESRDGERLGRRKLLHAHGTRRFTRSDTFDLPAVDCVVVRGHDQTHGYGGRAMLVTLETGAIRAVDQGSEKQSFAGADCP